MGTTFTCDKCKKRVAQLHSVQMDRNDLEFAELCDTCDMVWAELWEKLRENENKIFKQWLNNEPVNLP